MKNINNESPTLEIDRIKLLMHLSGITLTELANRLGCSKQRISAIFTGRNRLDVITARAICNEIGVTYEVITKDEIIIKIVGNKMSIMSDGINTSLRDKLYDFIAKYWYDSEYKQIDKHNHKEATESRNKFRKWFDDNIEAFL